MTISYIDQSGRQQNLPNPAIGDIIVVQNNGQIGWSKLQASLIPVSNSANFNNVEGAITWLLSHVGAVSKWSTIAPGKHRHNNGNGELFVIDTNAVAIPYSNAGSQVPASNVQAAIDYLFQQLLRREINLGVAFSSNPAISLVHKENSVWVTLDLGKPGSYDNTASGIPADSVQKAIDHLESYCAHHLTVTRTQDNRNRVKFSPDHLLLNISPSMYARVEADVSQEIAGGEWSELDFVFEKVADTSSTDVMSGANKGKVTAPINGVYTATISVVVEGEVEAPFMIRPTLNGKAMPFTGTGCPASYSDAQVVLPVYKLNAGDQIGIVFYCQSSAKVIHAAMTIKLED